MEFGGVAVAEVAEEIDLPLAVGKELGGDKAGEKKIAHPSKCDGIRNYNSATNRKADPSYHPQKARVRDDSKYSAVARKADPSYRPQKGRVRDDCKYRAMAPRSRLLTRQNAAGSG